MFPPVFATVAANATVQSLFGTTPTRVYPAAEAPQGLDATYAVWQSVGGSPENYVNTVADMDKFGVQIDVYAASLTAARTAAAALRDAIEPAAYVVAWNGEFRDPDTKLFRYSFSVDWLVERS